MSEKNNINIGDLVQLREPATDNDGFGIVVDMRNDTYDLAMNLMASYNQHMLTIDDDFIPQEITEREKELMKTPVYQVLWHFPRGDYPTSKPIWMYQTEIIVISKAIRKVTD